jgi:hypothetical protein
VPRTHQSRITARVGCELGRNDFDMDLNWWRSLNRISRAQNKARKLIKKLLVYYAGDRIFLGFDNISRMKNIDDPIVFQAQCLFLSDNFYIFRVRYTFL